MREKETRMREGGRKKKEKRDRKIYSKYEEYPRSKLVFIVAFLWF